MSNKQTTCGHSGYYAKGLCRKCYEKDLKIRNPEYAERQRENVRKWAHDNPDRKRRSDAAAQRRSLPENRRARTLRNRFGITQDDYLSMLEKQNGKCAICGMAVEEYNQKHFHIDHDHNTGKIRGLLCFRCNYCIGWMGENVDILERAIQYLKGETGYGCETKGIRDKRDGKEISLCFWCPKK